MLQDIVLARSDGYHYVRQKMAKIKKEKVRKKEVRNIVLSLYEQAQVQYKNGSTNIAELIASIADRINMQKITVKDAQAIITHINNGDFEQAEEKVKETPENLHESGYNRKILEIKDRNVK